MADVWRLYQCEVDIYTRRREKVELWLPGDLVKARKLALEAAEREHARCPLGEASPCKFDEACLYFWYVKGAKGGDR